MTDTAKSIRTKSLQAITNGTVMPVYWDVWIGCIYEGIR